MRRRRRRSRETPIERARSWARRAVALAGRARAWAARRRAWRWARLPPALLALLVLAALGVANVAYQVARKPTEVLGVVVPTAPKAPEATWRAYGSLFDAHSTEIVTPELLAALAQIESAGDPLARTYWRWRWSWNPFEVWAPASSAVGMLQITDGAYEEARRLCIRDHAVARSGAWYDPRACWFNGLYFRTVPSHAIEMTAASLHQAVLEVLGAELAFRASLADKQRLAAVIHLCGRERGALYARRGFRARRGERCGDHDLAGYVAGVERLEADFTRMGPGR